MIELKETVKPEVWPEKDLIWVNRPIKKAGRKRESQIFRGSNPNGSVVEEYRHITKPLEAFDTLFDEFMINIILGTSKNACFQHNQFQNYRSEGRN